MSLSADLHQKAIALLHQLPPDRLVAVVQLLEFLAQPSQAEGNAEETALLQVIGQQLKCTQELGTDPISEET
ncbi:hypothetical protein K9N68_21840 [Kovacikia minuta CCNUW1]|uniref:hypothetical protein n=1 Tax=Kovacikia minuta TaxID=2931930 RepID=UPI001CCF66DC|nr:hypothetical protein [Kovacikia minuta]UBF24333.1 hypothetical protein K9N68_21840 [Kovacikia minuta CCNUW1]